MRKKFGIKDLCGFCQVDVIFPLAKKHYKSCCDVTIIKMKGKIRVYRGKK